MRTPAFPLALLAAACASEPPRPLPPLANRCLEVRPTAPRLAARWGAPAFAYLDTVADEGGRGAFVARPVARDSADAARLRAVYPASTWAHAGEGDSLRLALGTGFGGLSFTLGAARGDTLAGYVSSVSDDGPSVAREGEARAWLVPCAGLTFR